MTKREHLYEQTLYYLKMSSSLFLFLGMAHILKSLGHTNANLVMFIVKSAIDQYQKSD